MARACARFDPDAWITHSNPAKVAVGRELDMIGLKRQVIALARELGRAEPFNLAFADALPGAGNAAKDLRPPAAEAQK